MKLLFDENLSHRLVDSVNDLYPGSAHVRDLGLASASDDSVWEHAITHSFVIVSKDEDFHQRSFLSGHPPKVIWVRAGNCTTADIEALLRKRHDDMLAFERDEVASFLALS